VHDYNGTQYLRARYYNTNTGRFDQRDSYMGEYNNPISQNRYTYVWNSPNQYMDRNGNWPSSKSGGIVGGIAGIISGSTTPKVSAGVKVSISTLKETTRLGTVKGSSQAPKRTSLAGGIAESVKEEVKKINEKVEIEKYLQNKNLKLPDLSNLSLETQIAYLREIKRICDEQLLQLDRWDPIGTQAYIDGLKPNKNGPITAEQVFKENLPEIIAGTIIGVGLIGYLLATGGAGLPTVVAIGGKAVSAKTIIGIGATISGGTIISGGGIIHYANKAYEKGEITEKDKNTLINGATTGIVFAIGGLITAGTYYFVNNGKVSGSGGSGGESNNDRGTSEAVDILDNLTDAQKSTVKKINNIIENNLTDGDFSGTLADLQGNPIKTGGKTWDHLTEMKQSYTGLNSAKRSLEGSLKNPNLDPQIRNFLQEQLNEVNSWIQKIEDLFDPFGGIL